MRPNPEQKHLIYKKIKKFRRRKKYIVFAREEDAGMTYRPTWADKGEPQPNTSQATTRLRHKKGSDFVPYTP